MFTCAVCGCSLRLAASIPPAFRTVGTPQDGSAQRSERSESVRIAQVAILSNASSSSEGGSVHDLDDDLTYFDGVATFLPRRAVRVQEQRAASTG